MPLPLLLDLGPSELLIILGVIILLFGAKKLPELARGSGQALRIFKAETKELQDKEDQDARRSQDSGRPAIQDTTKGSASPRADSTDTTT